MNNKPPSLKRSKTNKPAMLHARRLSPQLYPYKYETSGGRNSQKSKSPTEQFNSDIMDLDETMIEHLTHDESLSILAKLNKGNKSLDYYKSTNKRLGSEVKCA